MANRPFECGCGNVRLEASGEPIVSAACFCAGCQKAGAQFEALPEAHQVVEADGGTLFTLFRKDRVACAKGERQLREYRLSPDAPTRRVMATCCNSPMFLEFQNGHWLSLYTRRLPQSWQPPLEMRVMTRDRRDGIEFDDALPTYRTHSGRFMLRLLLAWAAMGFRAPKLDYVKGQANGTQ